MKDTATYLKLLAILCGIMTLFGIGIFIVGYKDLSLARVAITLGLLIATGVFAFLAKRKSS